MNLLSLLAPELVLIAVACVLFFLGTSNRAASRRLSAIVALATLAAVFVWQLWAFLDNPGAPAVRDDWNTLRVGGFTTFVKMLATGVGGLLVLLAWPSDADGTGSPSMNVGHETGEFFALMLLSISGVMVVAGANDIILLFLGIELASIPTYIMVSISRPLPVAQEAGVKYFFLGAMAAAVMLFGFSYLYGTTGKIKLDEIAGVVNAARDPATGGWGVPAVDAWMLLGAVMLLAGFAFKIAAVPLHAYVGDVYQGAATPVTAMLGFVPKTAGFVAIIKLLSALGGEHWAVPDVVTRTLWVVAVLTMTVGNVLALLPLNVKRVFAYSSIAHSGYMLVGVTALVSASQTVPNYDEATRVQGMALQGVLFYLLAYGVMNTGALTILMLLPTRAHKAAGGGGVHAEPPPAATTAETFEDLAGQGRIHPWLGLAMAICCFSLVGLPLTVGFFGKYYLIQPALKANLPWLVGLTMLNAAVSAAYYLKIVATMFIRLSPVELEHQHLHHGHADPVAMLALVEPLPRRGWPMTAAVVLTIFGTLFLGMFLPFTDALTRRLAAAALTVRLAPVATTPPSTPPAVKPAAGAATDRPSPQSAVR